MKLARVWVASVMVLACCAVTAHGATKTATGELESRLLEEVRNSTSGAWMGPAVNAQDSDDDVMDFWKQFRDPALIAATERWVQGRQFDNSNTLIAQWTREFGRIAVGGINYWTDDEIDTYLRGSMHQGWIFNRELCLNPTLGLRSAVDIEPGDLIAFLQTIKRTHLAAQAHQVPRPALTASDTEDAYMAGLEVMPQANRNQFVDLVKGGRQRLSASQRCEAVEILLRGVLSVPAEAGQQMRRAYFLAAAPRMFAPPKEMRPQKEAQVPTVNGRILAVTVPAEWEEKIVGGEGEPVLRLTSIKSSIEFYGVAEKTGNGTAVTLDGLRPAIFRIAESLKPCTEDDVRPTLFAASEGEGAWIFCTDPAHNAADPDDFKYTYTGVMKIDETYVSFKVLSNEEAADVKSGMHDLLRTIRFYKTPELPNAQGKK